MLNLRRLRLGSGEGVEGHRKRSLRWCLLVAKVDA
uniref:Uncharacterized protein n=1 Tax=Brassica campestris TaxID=3711 RepID=A0A3P5Z6R9_BRACM|nr:unnamed protein product [Brassica rapa]